MLKEKTLPSYAEPKPEPTFGKVLTIFFIGLFAIWGLTQYIESLNPKSSPIAVEATEAKTKLTPEYIKTMSKDDLKLIIENADIVALTEATK
jgi:hypothetical protein